MQYCGFWRCGPHRSTPHARKPFYYSTYLVVFERGEETGAGWRITSFKMPSFFHKPENALKRANGKTSLNIVDLNFICST